MNAYNNDLAYFYLGRSAEELKKFDAAQTYYDLAKTAVDCNYLPAIGMSNCDGFPIDRLIREAEERLPKRRDSARLEAELQERKDRLLAHWVEKEYEINDVNVVVQSYGPSWLCSSGSITRVSITGVIDRDASFSIERILRDESACVHTFTRSIIDPLIILESDGGLVADGYKLGSAIRTAGATTAVLEGGLCASACALAFLGGEKRIVGQDAELLFHSPYYRRGMTPDSDNAEINCEIGDAAEDSLMRYYRKMLGPLMGKELYDRTMSYCSTSEGWLVRGANAAKLFEISTQ